MGSDKHKILTKAELSEELSISTKTIERLMDKGLPMLRGGRVIRFDFLKVVAWMEKSTNEKEDK